MRFVLASTSPARLALLRAAGLDPEPIAPGVDEEALVASLEREHGELGAADMVQRLARAKVEAVASRIDGDALILGGDSAFEIDGQIYGKPHTTENARARWATQNGRGGTLWSGHWLVRTGERPDATGRVAAARVNFAELSETEIDAYVATGEPLAVAGAFTIDSLGGPFIKSVEGDPSTVVGLSLSTLRELTRELGVDWPSLWHRR